MMEQLLWSLCEIAQQNVNFVHDDRPHCRVILVEVVLELSSVLFPPRAVRHDGEEPFEAHPEMLC